MSLSLNPDLRGARLLFRRGSDRDRRRMVAVFDPARRHDAGHGRSDHTDEIAQQPTNFRNSRRIHDGAGTGPRGRAIYFNGRAGRDLQAVRSDDACLPSARPSPGGKTELNMRAIGVWLGRATGRTTRPPSRANPIIAAAVIFSAIAWMNIRSESMPERRLDGFNVVATSGDPFGSAAANLALTKAKEVGATAVAVIPFLWQPNATSPGSRSRQRHERR